MAAKIEGHRFNDDLLANPPDLAEARSLFPNVIHILDHPELRELFRSYDIPANIAKKRSRRWGLLAVSLGTLALIGASGEPLFHDLAAPWPRVIAAASALLGLVSVTIVLRGVLWSRSKSEWLQRRLMTERLRQFHFQAFVCRWSEMINSLTNVAAAKAYVAKRDVWFAAFKAKMERGLIAELGNLMREINEQDIWLHDLPDLRFPGPVDKNADELFQAYRMLRIEHQLRYANYKLNPSDGLSPTSAYSQRTLFANASLLGLAILIAIHLIIVLSVVFVFEALISAHVWFHIIAIWVALIVLAIRTLEEGLQTIPELERYRRYRASVRSILQRFNTAQSPQDKVQIMKDMERLSFEEMVDFLRANNEARFVI